MGHVGARVHIFAAMVREEGLPYTWPSLPLIKLQYSFYRKLGGQLGHSRNKGVRKKNFQTVTAQDETQPIANPLPLDPPGPARRAGSDGNMSASGLAGTGFDPRRGSKFSFENFQLRG